MKTNFGSREEMIHRVVTLHHDGTSQRAISRALGMSRNTVKSIVEQHAVARETEHSALPSPSQRVPRPSKLDPYKERVQALLAKYSDITAQRIFERLREEGFDGGYTAVKKYLRKVRPPPRPKPSLETPDWQPGEMAESDWSPYDITFTTGETQHVEVFSYTLTFSTRKSFSLFDSYDVHALMQGHEAAFQRFGGCAKRCKYDGQKAVAHWEGNQPIYNPQFLAFCAHYEMRPWALRGNPNLRPRVESSFSEFLRSFLNGREFKDIDDLRRQMAHWLDTIVDPRPRNGTTALARFEQEAPHLVPLPRHPYDTARVVYRICGLDGYVNWLGNLYAVPYDYITDILPVRITRDELFIYAPDLRCIARHELAPRGMQRKLDPMGSHRKQNRKPVVDLDQIAATYNGMGEGAARFFSALKQTPARQWSHAARRILLLRERYSTAALDAALDHAQRFDAMSFESVERILQANHPTRTLDEYVAAQTAERISRELGESQTRARDLKEYDVLPGAEPADTSSDSDLHALQTCNEDLPSDNSEESNT